MSRSISHICNIPQVLTLWQQVLGEARTRILLWYLLILGTTFLIAIPAFRYQLYQRIDERGRQAIKADMMAFQALIGGIKLIPGDAPH
jgi:hypothetical protein